MQERVQRQFGFTRESLENLNGGNIPEKILKDLEPLIDQKVETESKFLESVKKQIGEEQATKYQKLILKHATENFYRKDIEEFLENGQSLEEADLRWSLLRGASLIKVNFKNANLEDIDLSDTDLRGAILRGTNLQGANLIGANLTRADLSKANLTKAKLDMSILVRANLKETCFKEASLYYALMKGVDVSNADFTKANLREANLGGAKGVSSAKFNGTDLREAKARYTSLDTVQLKAVQANIGTPPYPPENGWRTKVFDFFKISWTEFVSEWIKKIFMTPFRFIGWVFRGLWKIIIFPFRLFSEKKKPTEV